MLQRSRLTAPLTYQGKESTVILRQEGRNCGIRQQGEEQLKELVCLVESLPHMSQRTESPSIHREEQMYRNSAAPPEWQERGHTALTSAERNEKSQKRLNCVS